MKILKNEKTSGNTAIAIPNLDYDPGDSRPLRELTPYVMFAHPLSKAFGDITAANPNIATGDPVLMRPDQPPLALSPFEFVLLSAFAYFAETDNEGMTVAATTDREKARGNRRLQDTIDTVVLVVLPGTGELVPARCRFRSTKSSVFFNAQSAVNAAADAAAWAKKGEAHRATLAIERPHLRVVHRVVLSSRTSRTSGKKYVAATSVSRPIPTDLAANLADLAAEPSFLDKVLACRQELTNTANYIKDLAGE